MRFLGGYSIFLAPLVGIYITDYFVVRKGNLWVEDLYKSRMSTAYFYVEGVNWRNAVAFAITVIFLVPEFTAQFGHKVGVRWEHIYSLGWILGCTISSILYLGLALIGGFCKRERSMGFEESYELQQMFREAVDEELRVETGEKEVEEAVKNPSGERVTKL